MRKISGRRGEKLFNNKVTLLLSIIFMICFFSIGCAKKEQTENNNEEPKVNDVTEEIEETLEESSEESQDEEELIEEDTINSEDSEKSDETAENEGPTIIIIDEPSIELVDESDGDIDVTQYDTFELYDAMGYCEPRLLAFLAENTTAMLEDGQTYLCKEAEAFLLYIPYNESGVKEVTSNYEIIIADGYYALFPLTISGESFEIVCNIEYNDGTNKSITVNVTVE